MKSTLINRRLDFLRPRALVTSCLCGAFLIGWASWLRADNLPNSVTLDFPVPANQATPAWLGHPGTPSALFATLALPILTPDPEATLLVTVYFQEKEGGFLRVSWIGTQGAQVLSPNFYEGIGMANQRSLLIAPDTLEGDGTLSFQCDNSTLGIKRVKLEWLENKSALISPAVKDTQVTSALGMTDGASNFNGAANPVEPGAWQNQIVKVPLLDRALRVDQGVEFSVDLDRVPSAARLALQESGLPLDRHLIVWVNEKRAGILTPNVPDLLDAGFVSDGKSATSYIGWRNGSFCIPVSLLKEGINTLQFSDENDSGLSEPNPDGSLPNGESPLALKNLTLQLNYLSTAIPEPIVNQASTTDPVAEDTAATIQPHLSVNPEAPLPLPDSISTTSNPDSL